MAKKRANGEGNIKTYLDAADKRGLLPMFYLELVTGLRRGRSRRFSRVTSTSKTKPSPSASSTSRTPMGS